MWFLLDLHTVNQTLSLTYLLCPICKEPQHSHVQRDAAYRAKSYKGLLGEKPLVHPQGPEWDPRGEKPWSSYVRSFTDPCKRSYLSNFRDRIKDALEYQIQIKDTKLGSMVSNSDQLMVPNINRGIKLRLWVPYLNA